MAALDILIFLVRHKIGHVTFTLSSDWLNLHFLANERRKRESSSKNLERSVKAKVLARKGAFSRTPLRFFAHVQKEAHISNVNFVAAEFYWRNGENQALSSHSSQEQAFIREYASIQFMSD